MAKLKDELDRRSSIAGGSADIDKGNYVERAQSFIKSRGGDGFVIRSIEGIDGSANSGKPATDPQWVAWMLYLATKEIPWDYSRRRGMGTVPSEWPENFDIDWPRSDRLARLGRELSRRGFDVRVDSVTQGFARLRRRIGSNVPVEPVAPPPTPDEVAARYAGKPMSLSSLGRRAMGLPSLPEPGDEFSDASAITP